VLFQRKQSQEGSRERWQKKRPEELATEGNDGEEVVRGVRKQRLRTKVGCAVPADRKRLSSPDVGGTGKDLKGEKGEGA